MRLLFVPSVPNGSSNHTADRQFRRTSNLSERILRFVVGTCGILFPCSQADSGKWDLARNQQEFAHFKQAQKEAEQNKSLQRARIPSYNLALSRESPVFQTHISDMHQRQVNCRLCREHVGRIRDLSKQIERAMK